MTPVRTEGRHETAIVDVSAEVDPSATIGPYSVIGPDVQIGARVRVGPHVYIERDTRVAADVHVAKGAVLGTDPQDLKYAGERTFLEVGPRTRIREFATLNRGTAASGLTSVGADALIMAYAHVAHDCRVGDHAVIANAVNMAGHVEIGEWAIVGGLTGIHQFVRVGRHAMVGGAARIVRDVAPYTIATGTPPVSYGVNRVGLKRRGFERDAIRALRSAFREIFRSGAPSRSVAEAFDLSEATPEVRELVEFVRDSRRGIVPGRSELPVDHRTVELPTEDTERE
ncbi:MAG: acyl-ACP--UDP-N-acetylglucosamine O-acyltransferase [Gemmatimonadetes bacterium]|nr:acyl-ACP--UDP-N-acetylglucosamine O-acyltransferase [Gemmatimonadota bacterium]